MKRFSWKMPHTFPRREAIARVKGGIEIAECDFEKAIAGYDKQWKGSAFRFTYQLNFDHPLVKKAIRLVRIATRGKVPIPDCLKVTGVLFVGATCVRIRTLPLAIHEKIAFVVFPIAGFHLNRRAIEVLS